MGYTNNSIIINKDIEELFLILNNIQNWPELHGYKNAELLETKKLIDDKVKLVFKIIGEDEDDHDHHHNHDEEDHHPEIWISQRIIDKNNYSARGVRLEPVFPFKYWILDIILTQEKNGTKMTWIQDFSMDPKTGHTDEEIEGYINRGSREEMQTIKEKIEKGTIYKKLDASIFD
jgi:aromatase